jgi:hypothetical protein
MTEANLRAPNETQSALASLGQRMLAALIGGVDLDTIGDQEGLPAPRVQTILRDELGRRWVPPVADFAKIQIARLESLTLQVLDRAENGELKAVDRALKIFDRLDRYHVFSRANPAPEPYGQEQRQRLLAKLNAIAERLRPDNSEG